MTGTIRFMADDVKASRPRPYHSPLRTEQADQTRKRILTVARRLFLERGYAGTKVTDVPGAMHDDGFDAVFLAVGAHIGKRAYVPAGEAARSVKDSVRLVLSRNVFSGYGADLLRGLSADERRTLERASARARAHKRGE